MFKSLLIAFTKVHYCHQHQNNPSPCASSSPLFRSQSFSNFPRKVSLKEEWTVSTVTFALSQPQTDAPGLNLFKIVLSLIGKQFNHVLNVFLVLNQSTMNFRCSAASCSQEHLSLHRDSTRCFPYRLLLKSSYSLDNYFILIPYITYLYIVFF